MSVETYVALGLDTVFDEERLGLEVNGRRVSDIQAALDTDGDRVYHPCPQASPRDSVARGEVVTFDGWAGSEIFDGTSRDVAVHLPVGLDRSRPAPLMVFNDGLWYLDERGPVRAAAVVDTLVHLGQLPPIVSVFVMPGRPAHLAPVDRATGVDPDREQAMIQRCVEYDRLSDHYVRMLDGELLPDLAQRLGLALTTDPARRAIVGISSGGICAFTAAWFRPESYGLVVSHCGSFVNIRGGHQYPSLIRRTERKPIRVFLQSGERDADIVTGSWPLANRQMAAALEFAGYDVCFEFGTGGHSLRHGGALFADTLRWLWRDAAPVDASTAP